MISIVRTSFADADLAGCCWSCHNQPDGYCTGDLRWGVSGADMGVCDQKPKQLLPEWDPSVLLLSAGAPDASAISHRMHAEPGTLAAMPPVGSRRIHAARTDLIDRWIASITSCLL